MGCQAITPHLVSLAKRLEGRPFHLLAAHCQHDTQENVVAYVKSKGLEATTPNFTVTSFGGHPKVKGNGSVPYYMVFDHRGRLAHHHMCGDYHGGDGLKMIEWVDKLLDETPAIYLGDEPFETHGKLAAQIAKKKSLAAAVKTLEAAESRDAEQERLYAAVTGYRDRMLEAANRLLATNPPEVLPALKDLQKELKGTQLGADVDARVAEMAKSADLKDAVKIWKSFQRTVKRVEKMDEPSAKALAKQAEKLEKLLEGHEQLPVAATIRDYIAANLRR